MVPPDSDKHNGDQVGVGRLEVRLAALPPLPGPRPQQNDQLKKRSILRAKRLWLAGKALSYVYHMASWVFTFGQNCWRMENNDLKVIFLKRELQIHCKESKKPEANMAMSGKINFFIFVSTFFFPVLLKRF